MTSRTSQWNRLGADVDVLVVGGGITGCGIARDAARRGLTTALVEARDFAYGTSSRSSKLVHGGLRYLEQFEFHLVFEAVSERRVLMDIAPHLVLPLGFVFPVYATSRQALWKVNAGMWIYDGLSRFSSPKIHRKLSKADVQKVEPVLRSDDLKGAPLYYDCSTDDARLTLENAIDAIQCGATVVSRAKVRGFLKDDSGRVNGAVVEDTVTGELREIKAKVVINATGPWTDRTLAMSGAREAGPLLRPTKGVHIVVDRTRLPVNNAVVCFHPTDGRVLFAIPWGDRTYVGTTDTDFEGDTSECCATLADIDYLLDASNSYFPAAALVREDVVSTWAGLRPLIRPPEANGMNESKVSREHEIHVGADGIVTIAGGKLTTYRRMAGEVVDTAVKQLAAHGGLPAKLGPSGTERDALPGAVGWPAEDPVNTLIASVRAASGDKLSDVTAAGLVQTYGTRAVALAGLVKVDPSRGAPLVPGRWEILAQVDWAVDEEMACGVSDVLVRRTQLFYRDADQGLGCAAVVGACLGAKLGWDAVRTAESVDAYREEVAKSRRWRDELPVV